MSNILLEYMKNRFNADKTPRKNLKTNFGPVVTISREYGCPAKRLASLLTAALNRIELQSYAKGQWKWIGKEILEQSAKELNLQPEMVRDIANAQQKGLVEDVVLSLSHRYYPGDRKIKDTIGVVIRDFAEQGHVIVVGRGGVSIMRHMPNCLHIKLQAPLEWRINEISKKQMITLEEAEKKIKEIDHKRQLIRDHFEGKKANDSAFDLILNYMTLEEDNIVAAIIKLMELKNMI